MQDISEFRQEINTRINNLSIKIDELDEFINSEDDNTSYTLDGEETHLADGLANFRAELKAIDQQLENIENGGLEDSATVRQGVDTRLSDLEESVEKNYSKYVN